MPTIDRQVKENTADIQDIKSDIKTIKDNHLFHIERDMEKQSKMIEKMDIRLYAILILLVGSVVMGVVTNGL